MEISRTIFVKHNAEIAHRLSLLPGKCQQIHGHSLQITIEMHVGVDENGIARSSVSGEGFRLDFGYVKQAVRGYIDDQFDHHLLLNAEDDLLGVGGHPESAYPGLMTMPGDPTIENISKWIGEWCADTFGVWWIDVRIDETNTNGATWSASR